MSPEEQSTIKQEHESIGALIAAFKFGPDAGLRQLEGKSDPESIRRTLIILLEASRYGDAAAVVHKHAINEFWGELAVRALVMNGEVEGAESIIRESEKWKDGIKRDRSLFAFANNLHIYSLRNGGKNDFRSPLQITEEEKKGLLQASRSLVRLLTRIEADGRVTTEFEQSVVELALKTAYLLDERARCEALAKLLASRQPVSLILAEAVLGCWIKEAPPNISRRLLTEHPHSFDAKLMSAAILAVSEGDLKAGFESAKELIPSARTNEQKLKLWNLLANLSSELGSDATDFLDHEAKNLIGSDSIQTGLWQSAKMLNTGKLDEAEKILSGIPDGENLRWLQLWAGLKLQRGKPDEAFDALKKAAELYPMPELCAQAAEIAFNLNRLEDASKLIEKQLYLAPQDLPARSRLAFIYVNMGDNKRAAQQFAALYSLQPSEKQHLLNQAISLELAGEPEKSLSIYETMCTVPHPPVEAYLGRAKILKSRDAAETAFALLEKVKAEYWDDPRFVAALLDISYAAKEDNAGHVAFERLQELQNQGAVQGALLPVSFEEIKEKFQTFQKKREELLRLNLEGKIPWPLEEQQLGRVPYWGWHLRTQSLKWLNEDPLICSEFSVYASNSLCVKKVGMEEFQIDDMLCPPKGTPVVADLSALITLHQLGLLNVAAAYFEKVLIPSLYVAHVLEESSKLVLHQKSQQSSLEDVKRALERGQIKVLLIDNGEFPSLIPHVNEYSLDEDKGHYYVLRDVADVLSQGQRITDEQHEAFRAVCHKKSGVDESHPPLAEAQSVLFDLSTLTTLHNFKLLGEVISTFEVHITSTDREKVYSEMRAFEALNQVYRWHSEMWDTIRKDTRFVQVSHETFSGSKSSKNIAQNVYMSATQLAINQKIPLLADDRVCQALAINEHPEDLYPAFGTEKLLPMLSQEGLISEEKEADNFLKLISLRYKFIVTPQSVLKTYAKRFISNPPGKALREVARYVHDSMRDPGLFGGFEKTNPPVSIGHRLFSSWATVICGFILEMWSDNSIPEPKAESITIWAIREMLPSPPRNVGSLMAECILSLLPRMVMSQAFVHSARIRDKNKANRALLLIAQTLGISDEKYLFFLTEVLDEIK